MGDAGRRAQDYPWVRLRWSTLAVLALLGAVFIALVATTGLAARIGVVLIAWPALAALNLAALLLKVRSDYGSFRALELARRTDVARQARATQRAQAWRNVLNGVPLRKIDHRSMLRGKQLLWALQKSDRPRFDRYYAAADLGADPGRRADLRVIGLGLLSLTAGRRIVFRRPPPPLVDHDVVARLFGPESAFADLAFEPLAVQLVRVTHPDADPSERLGDPILLASEIAATTCFLVGAIALLMDVEAAGANLDRVYDKYFRVIRRKFGVRQRPASA